MSRKIHFLVVGVLVKMGMGMEEKRFVFVCGLHRSGTSLITRLIGDHQWVSTFQNTGVPEDEGQHLQTIYPPAKVFGGPGRFGFDRRSYMDEHSAEVTPENGQRLFAQWSSYWDLSLPYLLEKSPPNVVRTRFLQALFPNSWFIIILRHPIAVSFATQKWSHTPIPSLLEHWVVCHERFFADRPHLHRSLIVHYETFVQSPEMVMERIANFLGLDALPVTRAVEGAINDKYFAKWRELLANDPRIAPWSQGEIAKRIQRFGYSLHLPSPPVGG